MGEEDTEDLAGQTFFQYPDTVQFSTSTEAHTSKTVPIPVPAPKPPLLPTPALASGFPARPRIVVRQDLLYEQNIATVPRSTFEGTHRNIVSETSVDLPETTETTQHERPQKVLLKTSINIPQTAGNTPRMRPKRTLLKTPGNSSLKACQKTTLGVPVEVPVQQHQDGKEIVITRMAQGPQQTVTEKDDHASKTEKGLLSSKAEGGLLISSTEECNLSSKTKKRKLNPKTDEGRKGQRSPKTRKIEVIPQASGTLKTEITFRTDIGQVSPRKNLKCQRMEKDHILTKKDKTVIQSGNTTLLKEDQVVMERAEHQKFTLTKGEFIIEKFKI